MITGFTTLMISFMILMILFVIIFVNLRLSHYWKLVLIPIAIWYGLVLYYAPPSWLGWALKEEPKDGTVIVGFHINEPNQASKGGIYLWGIYYEKETAKTFSLNPKRFLEIISTAPRAYVIPYDRELHKQLLQAQKDKKNGLIVYQRGKKKGTQMRKGQGQEKDDRAQFRVKNPKDILVKEGDER